MSTSGRRHIPVRPIAPRPRLSPNPSPTHTTEGRASTLEIVRGRARPRCRVCFRVSCRLLSHRLSPQNARNASPDNGQGGFSQTPPDHTSFVSSYAYRLAHSFVDRASPTTRINPSYDLPIPNELNKTEMHHLFHSWFCSRNVMGLDIPIPRDIVTDVLVSPLLAPALVDTALCLSILAIAAASQHTHSSESSPNVLALTLIGHAMKRIREDIQANPQSITDNTIASTTILWATQWHLKDSKASRQHGMSVFNLVRQRGGLQNLGMAGALARYIGWTDIFNSLYLGEECLFPSIEDNLKMTKIPKQRYGSFWGPDLSLELEGLDPIVCEGSRETVRLIEILEYVNQDGVSGSTYWYVLTKLSVILVRASEPLANYHESADLNEVIVLAAYLVTIKCFCTEGRAAELTHHYGARLEQVMKEMEPPLPWQNHLDLLTWLLFASLLSSDTVDRQRWSYRELHRASESRFGKITPWPVTWRDKLRQVVFQFVWSENRLARAFNNICTCIWEEHTATKAGTGTGS